MTDVLQLTGGSLILVTGGPVAAANCSGKRLDFSVTIRIS